MPASGAYRYHNGLALGHRDVDLVLVVRRIIQTAIAFSSMDWFGARDALDIHPEILSESIFTNARNGAGMQLVFVNTNFWEHRTNTASGPS